MPLDDPVASGGYFVLEARGRGERRPLRRDAHVVLRARRRLHRVGSASITTASSSCPSAQTYKPGDTARIMIQSPWEQATALVTTEREGVRSHRQFALTSTQQSITCRSPRTTSRTCSCRCCSSRGAPTPAPANAVGDRRQGRHERSRQAVVPPRLRRAEGRGPRQAADRGGRGRPARSTGRRPRPRCAST